MMETVTVVIPTHRRPAFLRDALASVRAQSARHRISQVVVSENSADEESAAVCAEFPDLPIDYVQQRPPVPAIHHPKGFLDRVRSPLLALLLDDDWWGAKHLESALAVLDAERECIAVYSSRYETSGPQNPSHASDVPWLMWLASGCDFSAPYLLLDRVSTLLGNLLNGTCHYSTCVGRTAAFSKVYFEMAEIGNTFDNDRMFPVFLSKLGLLGYLPRPDTFVRLHPGMDSMRPEHSADMFSLVRDTTRWMLKTEPEIVSQAARKFNETMRELPLAELPQLRQAIYFLVQEPQWTTLVDECGLNLPPRATWTPPAPADSAIARQNLRRLVKKLCPRPLKYAAERVKKRLLSTPPTLQACRLE